jgi:hypothetical protein
MISGLRRFRAFRIAGDQAAQFLDTLAALSQIQQRKAFFQLCGGRLVSARILIQHFVVGKHRRLQVFLAILDLSKVELGVAGQICVAIELEILRKLRRCQIILAGVEITQRGVVERIGGRSLVGRARSARRARRARLRVGDVLLLRLDVIELFADF